MNGKLIQQIIDSVIQIKKYLMELLLLFIRKDQKNSIQKLLLSKRQLKMSKLSKMTIQVNLVILVRAKKVEVLSLFMVLKMFRDLILGMQLDVFMANLHKNKFNQITIQESLSGKIAEMQYIQKKIEIDRLGCQLFVKIFLQNNLRVSLTIRTMEMSQKLQIYFFHQTFRKKEFLRMILGNYVLAMKSNSFLRKQDSHISWVSLMLCLIELKNLQGHKKIKYQYDTSNQQYLKCMGSTEFL